MSVGQHGYGYLRIYGDGHWRVRSAPQRITCRKHFHIEMCSLEPKTCPDFLRQKRLGATSPSPAGTPVNSLAATVDLDPVSLRPPRALRKNPNLQTEKPSRRWVHPTRAPKLVRSSYLPAFTPELLNLGPCHTAAPRYLTCSSRTNEAALFTSSLAEAEAMAFHA